MTEINVISSNSPDLTSDERANLFSELSQSLGISMRVFENIEHTINKHSILDALLMMPNLLMLKIRQISMYNNILPILLQKTNSNQTSVNIIFQNQQRVVYYNNLEYVSPDITIHSTFINTIGLYTHINNVYNTEVAVCGFIFLPNSIMNIKEMFNIPRDINIKNIIRTGNSDTAIIDTVLINPYESNINKLYDSKIWQFSNSVKKYVIFNNESHANLVCDILLNQLRANFTEMLSGSRHLYVQDLLNYTNFQKYSGGSIPKKNISSTSMSKLAEVIQSAYILIPKKTNIEPDIGETIYYTPSENIQDITHTLSTIFPGTIGTLYENAIWSDIERTRMPYLSEIIAAEYNHDFKDITDILTKFIKNRTAYCEVIKKKSDSGVIAAHEFYTDMLIEWYYIKTFGFIKYKKILEKIPVGLYKLVKFIDYVDKKDADITLLNMERDQLYQEALKSNSELTEFAKLLIQLNKAESDSSKIYIYSKIKDMIPDSKSISISDLGKNIRLSENDWIRTKDKFPIICPHTRDFYDLTLDSEKYNQNIIQINEFLIRNYGQENTNYCRICGAIIIPATSAYALTSNLIVQGYSHNDDELRQYIWKQVRQVVSYNIEFKHIKSDQDIKGFISRICDGLYTFVNMIEKNLNKIKTMSDAEIDARKRLFTTVYTFAFLIRIVSIHYSEVRFKYEIYDRATSNKYEHPSSQKLMKYAVSAIMNSQNTIINTISQLTGETINDTYIQNILTKSYDNITSIIKDITIGKADPIDYSKLIILDPRYKWLASANVISKLTSNTSITVYKNIWTSSIDPAKVLGTESNGDISMSFINVKNPFPDVKYSVDIVQKITKDNSYINALALLAKQSYEYGISYMLDYIHSKFYDKPVWNVIVTNINNILDFNTSISKEFTSFYSAHQDANIADQFVSEFIKKYKLNPFIRAAHNKRTIRFGEFTPKDVKKLSLKYGAGKVNSDIHKLSGLKTLPSEKFHKHNWSIVKYIDNNNTILRSISEVSEVNYIKSNSKSLKVNDIICSICYNLYSDIQNIYTDIADNFREFQNQISFYNYYSYCCPVTTDKNLRYGEMFHNFSNGTCVNCSITQNIIDTYDITYYTKYKTALDTRHIKRINNDSIPIIYKPHLLPDRNISTNWKFSTNIITEFCSLMYPIYKAGSSLSVSDFHASNITKNEFYNLIINIGITKDHILDEIKNGKSSPYIELDSNSYKCLERRNMLHPLIQNIISDTSTLSNIKNIASIPSGLQNINDPNLSKINISQIMNNVSDKLELKKNSYYEIAKRLLVTYNDAPINISNITLAYLLYLIIEIQSYMRSINIAGNMITEFVLFILHGLMVNIDISCRLSSEKMVIMAAISSEQIDPNLVDNRAEMSFDDLVDPDAVNQFSYDNIDYDGKNDEGVD